jgi:HTH-type transcriptional regulator/antitoxin HigA
MMASGALDFTRPHVLRNAREYEAAVAEIDRLLDADPRPGTEWHDRLEFLSVLVEAYETDHVSFEATGTPQSVVAFMLEQRELTRADLAGVMGGRARVSEFFGGKRPLSMSQVKKLRDLLHIPADLLIEESRQGAGSGSRRKRPARSRRSTRS